MFQDKAADRLRHLHQVRTLENAVEAARIKRIGVNVRIASTKNRRDIPEFHGPVEEQADKQGIEKRR